MKFKIKGQRNGGQERFRSRQMRYNDCEKLNKPWKSVKTTSTIKQRQFASPMQLFSHLQWWSNTDTHLLQSPQCLVLFPMFALQIWHMYSNPELSTRIPISTRWCSKYIFQSVGSIIVQMKPLIIMKVVKSDCITTKAVRLL